MEKIIVATDFSPAARNAVEYGVELAKSLNAGLILLNAYPEIPDYQLGFAVETLSMIREDRLKRLEALKKEILKKAGYNFNVKCITAMGTPMEVINNVVAKENAGLLIAGIVGEAGSIKQHLIGSTSVELARELNVPTLIIPEFVKYKAIRKICFACDLVKTEETDQVYIAKYFSNILDAELEVIHVDTPEEELVAEVAKSDVFVEQKLQPSKKNRFVHISGENVIHELENYFEFHKTDLIMLNPKKHNLFYYLFKNSVTKELSFHANLPILAIH